jgi:hypothetical protein
LARTLAGVLVRAGLLLFALVQAATGVWMLAAPKSFFDHLGAFGVRNDHYLRDVATFYLASAVVAAIAVWRRSWRAPVLTFAALQYALHAVNHIRDAGSAHADTSGAFDAVSLAVGAALLAWLAWRAAREPGALR